jgi:hypothetical protein
MNTNEQERIQNLLRHALPPVSAAEPDPRTAAVPARDLWPAVLRRLDERPVASWFDWTLVAGLGVCAAASPAWIPVILYFL